MICFLTGTLNALAGAERMTAVIANALAERGYQVCIISLWDKQSAFALHPSITHISLHARRPSFKWAYAATVMGIRRAVKQYGIGVLIEVDTMLALFTLPATLGLGVRHIAWEHCHVDQDLGKPMRRVARILAARLHSAVVVLTARDSDRWRAALRPRSQMVVIPNPLPFAFPPLPAARATKTVLAVGRLTHAKGFDLLLRAWARVAPGTRDWRLVIVGEGEERAALEALRDTLGLRDSVELPGSRTDIAEAYRQAAVFCLSSRYEGFGLVLLEAMSFGLPVVATDCETGPRELLSNQKNALTVGICDQAIARGIAQLIEQPALAARIARAGREFAGHYTVECVLDLWIRLLDRDLSI
ncbi:glycosyltransferase family 4 protein [Cupriavidus basilensis]|uniref:glycosyltransferase family 4 protein n=1 Tax=Cupriavidus basilensis TaxID=68895 RepID=UPI0023E8FB98|nr:glycosyltransferase family 4 protein [Cupriavidus basilensis]MDF3886533.1 glycosyltransferase family 4 protein [Cupriavidus basilensis]